MGIIIAISRLLMKGVGRFKKSALSRSSRNYVEDLEQEESILFFEDSGSEKKFGDTGILLPSLMNYQVGFDMHSFSRPSFWLITFQMNVDFLFQSDASF